MGSVFGSWGAGAYYAPVSFAQRCADAIRSYWAELGFKVEVSVGMEGDDKRTALRPITSNLVNGLPPGFTKDKEHML